MKLLRALITVTTLLVEIKELLKQLRDAKREITNTKDSKMVNDSL